MWTGKAGVVEFFSFAPHLLLTHSGLLFFFFTNIALDMYLYPDDPIRSAWASLLIGIGTGIVCHAASVHHLAKEVGRRDKLSLLTYGFFERVYSYSSFLCRIVLERGLVPVG